MYLSTHYCRDEQVNTEVHGYSGLVYGEFGLDEPLSGLSAQSFWPTRASLLKMLHNAGFGKCRVTYEQVDHEHGPLIGLSTRVRRFRRRSRRSARAH
jgi:hypothetical protein